MLSLDPTYQLLFLDLLLAQQEPAQPNRAAASSALVPLPTAMLLPVLRLLCGTSHSEVRSRAWRVAAGRLEASDVCGEAGAGESELWLECLPR